jgi:hypothetical protein
VEELVVVDGLKLREEEFILSELTIATFRCSKSNKLLKRLLCATVQRGGMAIFMYKKKKFTINFEIKRKFGKKK